MNVYAQLLAELQQQPDHELKQIGDQWQTPKELAMGLFWHFTPKIGPVVLDLFASDANALAPNYYTAEVNALTQEWANDLRQLGGAAFANPPYSRPQSDSDGTPITGIENILAYCREQRELGAKIMLLIKAGTSEGWWPEDADFIQFISGRIGFKVPNWYVPRDPKKDKPSSSGFASAVVIFDKEWKWDRRPIERLNRNDLETQGGMIMGMIESRANAIVTEREQSALLVMQQIPSEIEEDVQSEIPSEDVLVIESVTESVAETYQSDDANNSYQLPFVAEPEEDFSDKTIEQIYEMDDATSPLLLMISITLLFGLKKEYSHREIQFAQTSLLTDGESTNSEVQNADALAIHLAMREFLRKNEATINQQHDFVWAMYVHCLRPSDEPLYKNVKTLIKIHSVYKKCNGDLETTINELESNVDTDSSNVIDLADVSDVPEISAEWIKEQFMLIENANELSDEQISEVVDKVIMALEDVYLDIPFGQLNSGYTKKHALYNFFARSPHLRTFFNLRSLRAEFRSLVQASIKEVANG